MPRNEFWWFRRTESEGLFFTLLNALDLRRYNDTIRGAHPNPSMRTIGVVGLLPFCESHTISFYSSRFSRRISIAVRIREASRRQQPWHVFCAF